MAAPKIYWTLTDEAPALVDKPRLREWSRLAASPCGRFTCAEWWRNGSNARDSLDLELSTGD